MADLDPRRTQTTGGKMPGEGFRGYPAGQGQVIDGEWTGEAFADQLQGLGDDRIPSIRNHG